LGFSPLPLHYFEAYFKGVRCSNAAFEEGCFGFLQGNDFKCCPVLSSAAPLVPVRKQSWGTGDSWGRLSGLKAPLVTHQLDCPPQHTW